MVNNADIQKFLVQYLKLGSLGVLTEEIRENWWRGDTYSYPNIRVRVTNQEIPNNICKISDGFATISIYSEDYSSEECQNIGYAVANYLKDKNVSDSTVSNNTIKSIKFVVLSIGGAEEEDKIWRVQVNLKMMISSK